MSNGFLLNGFPLNRLNAPGRSKTGESGHAAVHLDRALIETVAKRPSKVVSAYGVSHPITPAAPS